MKIFVDADACPKMIKEVLYKVVERVKLELILVADQFMRIPQSEYIRFVKVPSGADSADNKIVELVEAGDLVITADIPLADKVISKNAFAINPRGNLYSEQNIKECLSIRNMMSEMREEGMETGGPPTFSQKDKQKFANQLDRFLTKKLKNK